MSQLFSKAAAIALDRNYAAAYAGRTNVLLTSAFATSNPDTRDQLLKQALASAQRAVAIAPEFGEAHLALGAALSTSLDFLRASPEFERALALESGSSRVQRNYAQFAAEMGHFDAAVDAARRAVNLDPQSSETHILLATVYYLARRFDEAQAAFSLPWRSIPLHT